MKALAIIGAMALALSAGPASAGDAAGEIEFLLSAVGNSGCIFIRNGKFHSAKDAEQHLRSKYRRGRRHATTSEKFIERLASASSMSRKPYYIRCGDAEAIPTQDWFEARLAEFRSPEDHP